MPDREQPDAVFANLLGELPAGAYLTGAVGAVSYMVLGEEDDDERGPFMAWRCDGIAGRWVHLGMTETVANDCRAMLRERDDD